MQELQKALDGGTPVNARDKYVRTPLHAAAEGGFVEVIERLIKEGADIDAGDSYKWTALHIAVHYDKTKAVEALLSAGANKAAVTKTPRTDGRGLTNLPLEKVGKTAANLAEAKANPRNKQAVQESLGVRAKAPPPVEIPAKYNWIKDTTWYWNKWKNVKFLANGRFDAPTDECRQINSCRWAGRGDAIIINWGRAGLHTVKGSRKAGIAGKRDLDGDPCAAVFVGAA